MRKPIIAANWKMNKTLEEARQFISAVEGKLPAKDKVDTVLCASFIHLPDLVHWSDGKPLQVGAQNMHFEQNGAYTGEVSAHMLRDLGVQYVIIGHSERRQYFNETDESVNLKVLAAHQYQLVPIICVGEQLEDREEGQTKEVVRKQTIKALTHLSAEQAASSVIAYEPVWAIGTGKTATPQDANEVIGFIRSIVEDEYDQTVASSIRIQYGGSVQAESIGELMQQPEVDGALVGGASLQPDSFARLVEGALS